MTPDLWLALFAAIVSGVIAYSRAYIRGYSAGMTAAEKIWESSLIKSIGMVGESIVSHREDARREVVQKVECAIGKREDGS